MTCGFKIGPHDLNKKKAFLTLGRERQRERERKKESISACLYKKVLIIMTGTPWTWAPAEVTNAQHCQFV